MVVQLHSFLILALDGSEWSASYPSHFPPGKEPKYPFYRRVGWSHSKFRWFGEGIKFLAAAQIWNYGCTVHSLVTASTMMSWFPVISSSRQPGWLLMYYYTSMQICVVHNVEVLLSLWMVLTYRDNVHKVSILTSISPTPMAMCSDTRIISIFLLYFDNE